jgi:hypothetical protein
MLAATPPYTGKGKVMQFFSSDYSFSLQNYEKNPNPTITFPIKVPKIPKTGS